MSESDLEIGDTDPAVEINKAKDTAKNEDYNTEETTEEERKQIRDKLSTVSFEDLLKMKQEMGSKLYNRTVFGSSSNKTKSSFKRANKNRPREMSSKRKAYLQQQKSNNSVKKNNVIPKDPRFDPACGSFDKQTFKTNYKFINDLRKNEISQLEKELQETKIVERKNAIKFELQRLNNQIREEEKNEKAHLQEFEEKKVIREKLKKGEKAVYKKKSVKKLENLISKYEELKKTNKLQKHIEKKSKKLSVKGRKLLERQS